MGIVGSRVRFLLVMVKNSDGDGDGDDDAIPLLEKSSPWVGR